MKTSLFIAALTLSATAFAAPSTKTRAPASTPVAESINQTTRGTLLNSPTDFKFHFSSNFVALSKSVGNASADFFTSEKLALSFRFETSSAKEYKKVLRSKIPTDRTSYGLGGSFWVYGNQARRNIVLSPYLAFGTKRDQRDVETLSGIGLKATALARITPNLTAEGGLAGNSLDNGDFKGDIYAGVGFLF